MVEGETPNRRNQSDERAFGVLRKVWDHDLQSTPASDSPIPQTSHQREELSLGESPLDTAQLIQDSIDDPDTASKDTVFYLAYGSNLSAETFKGVRGIKPLSQVNVHVPELDLTFDLPGLPYLEPCFANTRYRIPEDKTPSSDYHKDRWRKGLVGVVYEVTKADYATIIATEGGGSSYQDIVVDCYEIPAGTTVVESHPSNAPFKAHTLFSPSIPAGTPALKNGDRIARPDPSYAQASARYLKLITDGAEQHKLPREYRDYLEDLRPYTITTLGQKTGKAVFMATWMPALLLTFGLGRIFSDKKGRMPAWLAKLTGLVFQGGSVMMRLLRSSSVTGRERRRRGRMQKGDWGSGGGSAEMKTSLC